jgi:hypothetical protein
MHWGMIEEIRVMRDGNTGTITLPLSNWGKVADFATFIACQDDLEEDIIEWAQDIYALALNNIENDREQEYFEEMFR